MFWILLCLFMFVHITKQNLKKFLVNILDSINIKINVNISATAQLPLPWPITP